MRARSAGRSPRLALLTLLWVSSTESGSGSDADSAAESDTDAESEPGSVGRFPVLGVSASARELRALGELRNRSAA